MIGLTLDAGAMIALERGERVMWMIVDDLQVKELPIAIPAAALAQVWRDGRRQVHLARFLAHPDVEIISLDDLAARKAGQLCGIRGTRDIVDASVVLCARERGHHIATSDPEDLARLDPRARLIAV